MKIGIVSSGDNNKTKIKEQLNRFMSGVKYNPILDITYEYVRDLDNGVLIYKVNNSDSSVGLMTYTGDELTQQNIIESTIKINQRFRGVISYRTNFGNMVICEIHNTKEGIKIDEVYNTPFGELDLVFPKAFSVYFPDKGIHIYSRNGRKKNDTGYLRIVEHKTAGVLIGVRFLTVGSDSKIIREVDILKSNGSKIAEHIKAKEWNSEYREKFGVSLETLYSRGTETIEILIEKGITQVKINGYTSHFY